MERIRVAGIIPYENGIMLMRREKPEVIYYAIPGGGLEEGETLEECCRREIKEELGIEVEVVKLIHETTVEAIGQKEYFYLCRYESGTFGTGAGPEFMESEEYKDSGKFIPEIVPIEEIKNINLLPLEVKGVIACLS